MWAGGRSTSINDMTKRWRQLALWLHILSSAGWMAQAMTLCVLFSVGLATDAELVRDASTSMALAVDGRLVGPLANASALTGIVLAVATPWGLVRHWWVLAKFAITLVQLYLGIFLLSGALEDAVQTGPSTANLVGAVLMASAIAFQGWLSVAKPWGRVRTDRRTVGVTAPAWVFVATVLVGLADLAVALVIGGPMPLLSMILLVTVLVTRRRWGTVRRVAATAS